MLVKIHIKTSGHSSISGGVGTILELENIHDKIKTVDINMTWERAIAEHFDGFRIDSNKYYVRRVRSNNGEPPHSLKEPISTLLSEFHRLGQNSTYSILIMEYDDTVAMGHSVGAVKKRVSVGTAKKRVSVGTAKKATTPVHAAGKRKRQTPERMDESPTRLPPILTPQVVIPPKHNGREWNPPPRQGYGNTIIPTSDTCDLGRGTAYVQPQQQRRVVATLSPRPRSQQWPEQQPRNPRQSSSANANKATAAEFKSEFLDRAKIVVTNSQLLQARHALREFKAASARNNDNKWTKWVLGSPGPVGILRILFDV